MPTLAQVECKNCYGCGRLHSVGHNGDPDDDGVVCSVCNETGVVDVDLEDECNE